MTEPCAIVPLPHAVDPSAVLTQVAGRSALERTVRSLLEVVTGARLVVSAASTLGSAVQQCLLSPELRTVAVTIAPEPGSRRQALAAGLNYLGLQQYSSSPVLIGDHRHPLAPGALAASVLAQLRGGHEVVVPAVAVTDTVKTVDDVGSVLGTVDRSALRTVQYPRGFTASALWRLVSGPSMDTGEDEFAAALRVGFTIATVDGDANAFPVELPRDAQLLDAIMACRRD